MDELDIYQRENSEGVVVSMGGQIPNNIALSLHHAGVKVMGTSPIMIDNAEDREKFSSMLDKLGIQQADWAQLQSPKDAIRFAEKVGFPVLVRPSFVYQTFPLSAAIKANPRYWTFSYL